MAPFPRVPAEVVQDEFQRHLLSPDQLRDRSWRPESTVSEFIRHRVRVTVFLLQRVSCDESGLDGPVPIILPAEQAEIRAMIRATLATIVSFRVTLRYIPYSVPNFRSDPCREPVSTRRRNFTRFGPLVSQFLPSW